MDISKDEYLVCGHEKGGINIWELEKGTNITGLQSYQ